jgi:hypothetical protein
LHRRPSMAEISDPSVRTRTSATASTSIAKVLCDKLIAESGNGP